MRNILFILFIGVFQVYASDSYSQNTKLTLDLNNVLVSDVLEKIESSSEFYFLYNAKLIDVKREVSISVEDKKISDILASLFSGVGVNYKVFDKQIILTPSEITALPETLQQQLNITGKITDAIKGEPMPGVNITVKGISLGTISSADGSYSMNVQKGATLVFSFIGMMTQEIQVGESPTIDVAMSESLGELEEVVITGYQTQKKVDLTGAISVVNVDKIIDIPGSNLMQTIQGRVPGVYVETSGSPTGEARTILIRGKNTLGNTDPLYIIDGVPTKRPDVMQSINPTSIESIQVLKDASAASIYGSRASNGVIIITTKEGFKRLKVEVNTNIAVQNYSWLNKVDMCNTIERGEILWQAAINDGTDPAVHKALYSYEYTGTGANAVLNKVIPVEWVGGNPADGTRAQVPGTDWQDVAYRNAVLTNSSVTISGGTENSTALLGLGYLNNQGIMKYTDFKKLSVRINTSHSFFGGKIKIGENLQLTKTAETPTGGDLGGPFMPLGQPLSGGNMQSLAVMLQPILPVYTEDGGWAGPIGSGFSDRNNVLHMLYIHKDNKKNKFSTFGNLYAEIKPVKNMVFRSSFGIDYVDAYGWWFEEKYVEGFLRKDPNILDVLQEHQINWTWSNLLTYNLVFGKHTFDMLAGMEALQNNYINEGAHKEVFALQDVDFRYLDAGTGSMTNSGRSTGNQLLSYFGKINYSMSDRYLASVTLRYDGSSRFGTENQFGLFPAASLGWRINNEEFFNLDFVSNLKVRVGVGRVGNQEIGDVARFGLYATNYGTQSGGGARNIGTAYDLRGEGRGTLPSGYAAVQTENNSLKWETTEELNIGTDFGLLDEKIIGSFDYFTRRTKDILIKPPYPGVVGEGGGRWENGATIENKGFEIVLGYRDTKGDINYSILGSISSFHDKITFLPEAVVRSYPGNVEKTILGHSQTLVFGYVTDGIFQNKAEVDQSAVQAGKGIGRIRWADLNHDGVINSLDQDWLGTTLPDFEYGINGEIGYKNFALSVFVQGVSGKNVYNSQKGILTLTHAQSGMNYGTTVFDGWTPNYTDTDIPAQSLVNSNDETRSSDYMYVNGSYFKFRTLQLSYSLPVLLTQKIHINLLRFYLIAENFFMIKDTKGKDKYFGTDPETANWEYPRPTVISLGLNLTL
ncbi:MAG: TonB-dependent receptor [Bacteroidota bacterium]